MSVNYTNLKIAVIGCGNWGKNHIRAFHQLGALYAVCDSDPAKASAMSQQYGVQSYTLAQILDSTQVNAVVIATPSRTHYEIATHSLQAHKHVFIEKPLCVQLKQGLLLQQLAEKNKCILMVGHLLQYHPAFNAVKKLNLEGRLGSLQTLYSHRCNFGKFAGEQSVLLDFAPHDVSMILSLIGEMPEQINAVGGNFLMHTQTDTTTVHLQFKRNIQAQIFVSWLHPYKEQKLIVVGDKGMVIFDDCQPWDNKLRLYQYPEQWIDGLPQPFPSQFINIPILPSEPLLAECVHFAECITHQQQPLTDGHEGNRVMAVLEAAAHSITSQLPVKLTHTSKKVDILHAEAV